MVGLPQALSSVAPQNFPIQCMSRLWFFLRPFWIVFLHFLKFFFASGSNLLLLSSMRPPPLAYSGLAFLSLFALFSLWACISVCFVCLYVFLYAYVCFCVFFHLNGIFYAIFVPFIALFIAHMFCYCNIWHFMVLFAYNLIAGMSKSLWYARTIPFWYIFRFLF